MNSRKYGRLFALGCLSAALVLTAGLAQASGDSNIAAVNVGQTQVFWQAQVSNDGGVLTVNGPEGMHFRQEFKAGQQASFDTQSHGDGSYNYELRLYPQLDPQVAKAMAEAREQGVEVRLSAALLEKGKQPTEAMVMSGVFSVQGGSIIFPQGTAMNKPGGTVIDSDDGVAKDFVINDDLIVDGSACIGVDCVNGESFGFDTLRLKENNLRIKFDDTSTSASFPNYDWQLTANDSANGGANKFSIDDITSGTTPFTIEGSAPSHSLFVDDAGRVGFGTSTPVVNLHVKEGNTPTLRLEQDGSSGFTPQTWDVAGNETNFFVRDATNGSTLPFRIRPTAPSNSIYVDTDGDVGFGTTSPDKSFDIEDSGPAMRLTNTGSGGGIWDFKMNANNGRLNITDDSTGARIPFKIETGADDSLLKVGIEASNRVDITGDLVVSGSITPDYVFEPFYQLESIEEHAAFMWRERHLPAVAPATPAADGGHQINVAARAQGVLEELEKAHIYIEQLNSKYHDLQRRFEELEQLLLSASE